jgi:hypothetical protein
MVISNSSSAGFFAELCNVIRHIKKVKQEKKKIFINWNQNNSLYFEQDYGENVWEYFFDKIDPIDEDPIDYKLYGYIDMTPYETMNMRSTFNFIYNNFITLKDDVKSLIKKETTDINEKTLGVHIRKTDKFMVDKFNEPMAFPIDDNLVFEIIDNKISDFEKIFLATDCTETYNLYKKRYGSILLDNERIRGYGKKSIHTGNKLNGYKKGLECLLDSYILSNCGFLIRSTSNLSLFSMFMNLNLQCININEIFREDFREHEFNIYSKT